MNEEDINKDNLNFSDKEGSFSLPENYFDSFSSKLFKKIAENEELKDYPILTSLQNKNAFNVPTGYFDLKEDLLTYPLLSKNKANVFKTPDFYFTALAERVTHSISREEEKETYALLYRHKKENVFTVPVNYFENIQIVPQTNPIVPLYKRISLSYKVAAAITLLLGLGVIFYLQQSKPVLQSNDCLTFACLDKKDILNSGYVLHVSDDNIIDLIDEKSLSDSLFLKKDGKTQKVEMNDVSDNVDINTLTDNL